MTTPDQNHELTQYRLKSIEDTLAAIGDSIRQLTALEQKHLETRQALERAFDSIGKVDDRVRDIELELPTLKLIRGWVIGGVISVVSLLGIGVMKLVTIT